MDSIPAPIHPIPGTKKSKAKLLCTCMADDIVHRFRATFCHEIKHLIIDLRFYFTFSIMECGCWKGQGSEDIC